MASIRLQGLSRSINTLSSLASNLKNPLIQCIVPRLSRPMATEATTQSTQSQDIGSSYIESTSDSVSNLTGKSPLPLCGAISNPKSAPQVLATIYDFPSMEPLRFERYFSKHLYLPLRRDILHRAVIYEGDSTRQGTASSKTRFEVWGSHTKIRPQKGTGRARLGTKQSPMLVGGGKSFGPHPRDFATGLPKKMYDLAWRTALSWRYRRGELIICEDGMDISYAHERLVTQIFAHNHWGKGHGRSLLVVGERVPGNLRKALGNAPQDGRLKTVADVDVKDLLELGRVVIEKGALDRLLSEHQSDLVPKVKKVL